MEAKQLPMKTPEQIARIFGCTVEQARTQLAKNAAQLEQMATKAKKTGKTVNNYTEAALRTHIFRFRSVLT